MHPSPEQPPRFDLRRWYAHHRVAVAGAAVIGLAALGAGGALAAILSLGGPGVALATPMPSAATEPAFASSPAPTAGSTEPSASPSPTAGSTEPSASLSPTPTAAATATAQPTPMPGPVVLGRSTWAVGIADLAWSRSPGGASAGVLRGGQPLFILAEPEMAGGQAWHRVTHHWSSTGYWVAGGTTSQPLLSLLIGPARVSWEGTVAGPTVAIAPTSDLRIEPSVSIGGIAFDADLFDPSMMAAFNVAWPSGISLSLNLTVEDGRTVGVKTMLLVGLCNGRGMLGGSGQLGLHADNVEIDPGRPLVDVDMWLHDALLGFPHAVATADLPNIGQALLISYYGSDGSTCVQVLADGERGSTTTGIRVTSMDCMLVVSRSATEVVLTDDSGTDPYVHRFVIAATDQVDPAVTATGQPIGLRVLTDRGFRGPDLQITLAPEACS